MVRLGEPESTDELALGHLGEVPVLLLGRSEVVDGAHGQRRLDRHAAPVAAVDALDSARDQCPGDVGDSGTAVAADGGTEEAQLAHLLKDFGIVVLIPVCLCVKLALSLGGWKG